MLTRQQIINIIRRMHRRGEALNISAVKRSHPELIRAVYNARPFWGWKQALEDAGIGYRRIKISLQDTVECELCGKSFRHLGNHLILKHEVRPDEYLTDYPDAELLCETMRAAKKIGKNRFLRHWEPAWSREYILDRAAEFHRQGFPVHYIKMHDIDRRLTAAASYHLGENAWTNVLAAIGLDPRKLTMESYRQSRSYPDKAAVIQGIKQRLKKGVRVIPYSLIEGKQRDVTLLIRAAEYFGSWANALQAAGLDLKAALKRKRIRKYQTQNDIINEIRARHKRKWPITLIGTMRGKNRDCMLGAYAKEYFGPWGKALKAAGFDPIDVYNQVRLRRIKYPDAKSVLKAIKRRIKEKRSLNCTGVGFGHDRDFRLLLGANRLFGSWNNALKNAGLDPNKIKHDARVRGKTRGVPMVSPANSK